MTVKSGAEYPPSVPQKYLRIDGLAALLHHTGRTTLPEQPPDLSRGETLLCLHGAGGNGAVFADLQAALAERHSPLAFDQPGHGRSGGLDSLGSIERMSAFARSLTATLGVDSPVLLGHSMGGAVALHWALERAGEPRALILASSGARFELPDEDVERLRRVTQGKARREFRREAYSSSTSGEIVRRGFMEDLKTDPRVVLGDWLALRDWDVRERLGEIRTPTLVVVGEDEFPPLRTESERLAADIPGARQVVIAKAGHMVPLEQPEALAEAVESFLGELA